MIRNVRLSDAKNIAAIYNYYIENTIITFETEKQTAEDFSLKIQQILQQNYPFIVYEENGNLIGYAYLNTFRWHKAYNITAETTIYLSPDKQKKGIGSQLYNELIKRAKEQKIHSLIGVLSLPNTASEQLHKKLNFQHIGIIKEAGYKFGKLIDVEFWQLIL